MKIYKILENLVATQKIEKAYNGNFGKKPYNRNTQDKALGSGNFSSVKSDPNDPHLVKKHSKRAEYSLDGYNHFINYIIDNNLMDNVHFPKVYNIKTISDKNNKIIHTYNIEKLIRFNDVNSKELDAFLEKTFTHETNVGIYKTASEYGGSIRTAIAYYIGYYFQNVSTSTKNIIDPSFKDAINIIRKIVRTNNSLWLDSKDDNMMWRVTPYGINLVFTDPIA